MQESIERDGISYRYDIINLQDMECDKFLYSNNPSAVVLSILCNFQDRGKQVVVNTILKRLKELTIDNEVEYRNYLKMVNILSSNRNLENEVEKGAKMFSVDIKKTPFYKIGMSKGVEDGIKKGLENGVRIVAKRMIEQNIDIETIATVINLSIDEINKLKKEKDEYS